jgi:two-component system phosphate regulon response regulator OmpR
MSVHACVLVVDDDKRLRELLGTFLKTHYTIYLAANSAQARAHLASYPIDMMIVDVMMPGEDGLSLVKSLRDKGGFQDLPILMLSAKDTAQDRIKGLDQGADDYLIKPFEPDELLARIRSLLRRTKPQPQEDEAAQLFSLGQFSFCAQSCSLIQGDSSLSLSSTEALLLKTLCQAPFHPFSREQLAQRIGHTISERSIDVQITRLRKKLGDDPKNPQLIRTIRHVGYALYPKAD